MNADQPSPATTAVICRRDQLAAAATVLACAPPGVIWPLVVLDPPPIARDEYERRFADYITARNARDLGPNAANIALVDAKFALLTEYRWWAKGQLFAGELLRAGGITRVAFLFTPPVDEFALIETTPLDTIGPQRRAVLAPSIAPIDLAGPATDDLPTFADAAWRALRDPTLPSDPPLRAALDDASVLCALGHALATGRRLILDPAAAPSEPILEGASATNEAVIVEVAPDARRLLGVLYAARRGAKLIVYTQPDTTPIERARQTIQASLRRQRVETTAPKGMWSGVTRLTTAPAATSPVDAFCAAVSAAVPDWVVTAVAQRDLTAFTIGVPYNAVRTPTVDWSRKPIGHITSDASLLVLPHLLATQPQYDVSFNLIFDPGYFTTAETQNVLTELQARVAPSLLLDGWSATILALNRLGADLPLDIIFFNTHGADDGIVLAGRSAQAALVPSAKLVRETLPSRPLIFNNSCQSWTGVGREFVLAGARGYIGSLWSIDASDAATYAKVVLARTVRSGATFARAMRDTGITPVTELAYLFIGTASDALAAQPALDQPTIQTRLLAAAALLRDSIARWLESDAGRNPTLDEVSSFVDVLWAYSTQIYDEYARRVTVPEAAAVAARLDQLEIGSRIVRTFGHGPDIPTLRTRAIKLMQVTPADAATRAGWNEAVARWDAAYYRSVGRTADAVTAYLAAISAAKIAGHSAVNYWLTLSDIYRKGGDAKRALEAAHAAEAEPPFDRRDDPRRQRLAILGRLGPASLALNDINGALAYAIEGGRLADALGDRSEQSEFVTDEARAYRKAGDRTSTAQRAGEAYRLAALAYDPARQQTAAALYREAVAQPPGSTPATS